jgi:hypothetical protein
MAAVKPYTEPEDIPQTRRTPRTKEVRISYTHPDWDHPPNRNPTRPQTNTNAKQSSTQRNTAPQTPTFNKDAFAQRIGEQVDTQIATLQTALTAQLEGPFVETMKHVVKDELISNNSYAIALQAHFAVFDHSKFTLIPATWKPSLESKIEQTNARLDSSNERLSCNETQSATTAASIAGNHTNNHNTKDWTKPQKRSISSLQAEVQSQENTVNRLSSSL